MRLAFELVESEQTVLPSVGGGSEYNKRWQDLLFTSRLHAGAGT